MKPVCCMLEIAFLDLPLGSMKRASYCRSLGAAVKQEGVTTTKVTTKVKQEAQEGACGAAEKGKGKARDSKPAFSLAEGRKTSKQRTDEAKQKTKAPPKQAVRDRDKGESLPAPPRKSLAEFAVEAGVAAATRCDAHQTKKRQAAQPQPRRNQPGNSMAERDAKPLQAVTRGVKTRTDVPVSVEVAPGGGPRKRSRLHQVS